MLFCDFEALCGLIILGFHVAEMLEIEKMYFISRMRRLRFSFPLLAVFSFYFQYQYVSSNQKIV